MSNYKRMIVAILRAMVSLFILGNAKLLGKYDVHWRKLIHMLSTEDEYHGSLTNVL